MDVKLPDGKVLKGVPDGTTKAQLSEKLSANGIKFDETPKSKLSVDDFTLFGAAKNIGKSVVGQMGEGFSDIGGMVKDALFMGDKQKPASDPESGYLEGYANSPGAKFMGASRIIPGVAVASSIFNNVVDPAAQYAANQAGINPKHVQVAETLLPLLGARAGKKAFIEPTAVSRGVRKVTDAVSHPLDTATAAVGTASDFLKPAVRSIEKGMLESDNPIFGGGLKKSLASDESKEGQRLNKEMGIKLSAGELTGNQAARGREDALANSAKYAQKFAEANEKKTSAVVGKFKSLLNTIYPKSVSRVDVGDKISSTYKDTIDTLTKGRSEQAKHDFGLANQIAGNEPVVPPKNFITALKSFIKEGDSPLATPAQQAASKQAKLVLGRLKAEVPKPSGLLDQDGLPIKSATPKEAYKRITIEDLQNGLALYGDGAHSGGGIWKGLSTASDRRFSRAAKAALEKDMDEASDAFGGPAATALKLARDKYRLNSNKISDVEKTTIGKMVGGAEHDSSGKLVISPEKMADKFLSMQPTEIKNTLQFLDKHHPDVAKMARRYALEVVLHKALEGKGQRGEGSSKPFPKTEFVQGLPDNVRLEAILGKGASAKAVNDVASALNRMIDWGASKGGSPTVSRLDHAGALLQIAKWGKGAIYRSLASDSLVDDLLDPTRNKELMENAKEINK